MKKFTQIIFITILSMSLSACMTTMLWNENSVTRSSEVFKTLKEDNVAGFAKVVQKDSKTNFLVIGTGNAYLIEEGSDDINQLLLLGSKNTSLEIITNKDQALELDIGSKKAANYAFKANLAFKVSVKEPSTEQRELFKTHADQSKIKLIEQNNELSLIRNIPVTGKIIMVNDDMKATKLQNMSKTYKVKVGYYDENKWWDKSTLIDNIIQTPFALAADAIIIPFAAVGLVIGAVGAVVR
jgi:hypothetical protein